MKRDYSAITSDVFDTYLRKVLEKMDRAEILYIPGVYELVSEELKNEVLGAWEEDNPQPEESETTEEEEPEEQ